MSRPKPRQFLLDASRLIWRLWTGRLPTGVDRVCLEYVRQFGSRSQAVLQFRGRVAVLSPRDSDRLFALLLDGGPRVRQRLVALAATAWPKARRAPPRGGMIYQNVGHTGLHDPALPKWIAAYGVKAVYLIHDLIPIRHPDFCRDGEAGKHSRRMENALRSSRGIIGNSQTTVDDMAAFAKERALPMPASLAAWIGSGQTLSGVIPRTLDRPYFITVGTIEARKNHLLLLRIWRELVDEMGDSAPTLVIVGQRGWKAEAAEAILDHSGELREHVRELSKCGDEDLAAWLKGARALLMPSFVEGFGLPIVEAFAYGTPVIASDLPVYREIVGDIPTYADAGDYEGWKAAILAFVSDGPERQRQKRMLEGYSMPGWPSHFASVEQWLQTL